MSGLPDRTYDKLDGQPMIVQIGGTLTINGTAASATAVTGSYFRVPFACKLVGATFAEETGATAAGPTIHLDKSTAGTGTYSAIGTCAFGTEASTAGKDFTVTATELADGDQLRLELQAGTTATSKRTGCFAVELVARAN